MSSVNFLEKLLDGVEVEWKTLGQTCKIETGKLNANAAVDDGEYMFFTTAKETSKIDKFRWDTEALLIAGNANVGEVKHYIGKFEAYQRTYVLTNFDEKVSVRFLYFVLSHSLKKYLEERTNSAAMTYIVLSTLENFPIPIPCPGNPQKSLAIQSEIVRILDKFTALTAELTAELAARKKQYNYYRDQLLSFEGKEVEWRALGEVLNMRAGQHISASKIMSSPNDECSYPCFGGNGVRGFVKDKSHNGEHLLIGRQGALCGNVQRMKGMFYATEHAVVVTAGNEIDVDWAFHMLSAMNLNQYASQSAQPGLAVGKIQTLKIPLPCIETQKKTAKILDKFDTLTNSITEGLPREIELRQKQYEYYRDLLFSFPKPDSVTN